MMKKLVFAVVTLFVLSVLAVAIEAQQQGQQQQGQQQQGQQQQQQQGGGGGGRGNQQPGATQGGPTTGREMMQPFDPRYLLGEWEIEWTPPDTPLLPAGKYTGIERVTHANHRFLIVDSTMESDAGIKLSGQGVILIENGVAGQQLMKYVSYTGAASPFALLQTGLVGGDLGGYYSHYWETPEFTVAETNYQLKGRSYFVSPAAYRVNQQISVNGEEFFNFGIMWFTKEAGRPAQTAENR
jgi:hypothetical protein